LLHEKKSDISFFGYDTIHDYRHFLYARQKQSDIELVIFYNAHTEEELFRARCSDAFVDVVMQFFLKSQVSTIKLLNPEEQLFFYFKRNFYSKNLILFDSSKSRLGILSMDSFCTTEKKDIIFLKKRGSNLEFYNADKILIGIKRERVRTHAFKPTGGSIPNRKYIGEIVFYQNNLTTILKTGLIGSAFL